MINIYIFTIMKQKRQVTDLAKDANHQVNKLVNNILNCLLSYPLPAVLVPEAGIEPARGDASTDFKSVASTCSATRAFKKSKEISPKKAILHLAKN